ncbi:hypothetical protein OK015_19615 [Mycobacterium sp. Aquia_216]|uniref:hypothetical protein n=1 Tax=Mycobacterium sp. Aquia_216 TaxID=2991729 RepID=UPI00227C4D04|nr:hypothetical protein [Mycobacterium sp. Aquia_216]WAJ43406.1 hypothetical protein OK015_19615 [Mycobacterium sp. Aquia_216]
MLTEPPIYGIPASTAHIAVTITAVGAGIAVLFFMWHAITRRDPLMIFLGLAGGLTVFTLEPFTDVLGLAVFPELNQIGWIHALGRHIPAYVGLIYIFYWAPAWKFVTHRLDHGMKGREFSAICAALVGAACLIEVIPTKVAMWTYYGSQPLKIVGFPIWWAVANGHSVVASAVVLYFLLKVLPRNRRFLLIVIMPPVVLAVHTLGSVFAYLAIGSTAARSPTFATYGGTLATMAFCTMMLWVYWQAISLGRRVSWLSAAEHDTSREIAASWNGQAYAGRS